MIIRPEIFNINGIVAAQSTRKGGVSRAPYESLNLGLSTQDKKEDIIENRKIFFEKLNINMQRLCISKQVHGNSIQVAEQASADMAGYDGIITNKAGIFLAVSIADCAPVLIYDTKNKAVAAIHAGWRGTVAGITSRAVLKMQQHYNTKAEDCLAYIGACIGFNEFEVGDEVASLFTDDLKKFIPEKSKHVVDLKTANYRQLAEFGLEPENIEVSPYCTVSDHHLFFSHRKEKGLTGRMIAVIGLNE